MAVSVRSVSVVRVVLVTGLLLTLLALATLLRIARADPAVLYVKPDGSGNCSTWDDACALQTALTTAGSGDEIWVAAGVYVPGAAQTDTFLLADAVALYGGFAGTEADREERNWEMHLSILSGDIGGDDITDPNGVVTTTANIVGDNVYHVVNSSLKEAVLDGFIITAGQANGYGSRESFGGGFINFDDIGMGYDLTLAHLTFSGNFARYDGGGLYNYDTDLSLTHVTFTGNTASSSGGGVFMAYHSLPILTNVTFTGNTATSGGAMYSSNSSGTLRDVTFSRNTASQGGAIFFTDWSSPALVNVIFSANTASDSGGAMLNVSQSSPTLTNVTFSGNAAPRGGAIHNHWISTPLLVNVAFYGNSATNGGGIYNSYRSAPTLVNAILWGDTPDEIYNEDDNASATITYSDVQGGWPGAGNIDADPLFADAVHGDLRLGFGSSAIDAGDNEAVPSGITTDLDGRARFVDIPTIADMGNGTPPLVDMGAYEYVIPVTVGKAADALAPANGQVVTFTVFVANTGPDLSGGQILDTLPAGLHFVGPVTLEPPDAGVAGSGPAALAHSLAISTNQQITVSFPVSVTGAVGASITNTAVFTAPQLPVTISGSVVVTVANTAPLLTSVPVTTATEDVLYTYGVAADDPDLAFGDVLTLTVPTLPTWLVLTDHGDGTVTLTGTPGNNDVGAHAVVLHVVDRYGLSDTQAYSLTVSNVNDAPLFTSVPVTTVTQDAAYTYVAVAGDPDLAYGDVLTLTAPTLPTWLALTDHGDGTATLTGTPDNAEVGEHAVVLQVTDSHGLSDTQAYSLTVSNVNDAPLFWSVPVTTATQDAAYTYVAVADDPDLAYGDVLTLTAPTLPSWLALTDHGDGTATLTGTPGNADVGQHAVVLQVTDTHGLSDTQAYSVTVAEGPQFWVYLPLTLANMP